MAQEAAKIATDEEIATAAEVILRAHYPIALTGAGMSVESGIPPFRGPGGLWTKYGEPPMNQFQRFMENPKKAWEERINRQNDELFKPLKVAQPNPGHHAFAELETMGVLKFVITQNVDDLHRQAGQKALAEIHGNWKLLRCLDCGKRFIGPTFVWADLFFARCPACRRMDLNGWTGKNYDPPFWVRSKVALGAKKWRCEYCRLNFASFRKRKEVFTFKRWKQYAPVKPKLPDEA